MNIKKHEKTQMDKICVMCHFHTLQVLRKGRWICSICGTVQPERSTKNKKWNRKEG